MQRGGGGRVLFTLIISGKNFEIWNFNFKIYNEKRKKRKNPKTHKKKIVEGGGGGG